jgi:hypothetical protein
MIIVFITADLRFEGKMLQRFPCHEKLAKCKASRFLRFLVHSASILLDVKREKCAKERKERKEYSGMVRKDGTYKSATQRMLMEVLSLVTYKQQSALRG